MALLCLFFSQKGHRLFISFRNNKNLKGKTMRNLETSSKKLQAVQTAIQLITTHGFNNVGVDMIARETKITKGTLYKYFGSKEGLIEMCIVFQKSLLKEEVLSIVYSSRYCTSKDKLKQIIVLHTNLNSLYNLLLKAIFEIKLLYPKAYGMAVEYRKWLHHEIFDLIFSLETRGLKPDPNMVLNLIDGLMLQVLSLNSLEERDTVIECFF